MGTVMGMVIVCEEEVTGGGGSRRYLRSGLFESPDPPESDSPEVGGLDLLPFFSCSSSEVLFFSSASMTFPISVAMIFVISSTETGGWVEDVALSGGIRALFFVFFSGSVTFFSWSAAFFSWAAVLFSLPPPWGGSDPPVGHCHASDGVLESALGVVRCRMSPPPASVVEAEGRLVVISFFLLDGL